MNETAPLKLWKVQYPQEANSGKEVFLSELREWLSAFSRLLTAEFQVVGIQTKSEPPRTSANSIRLQTMVRFELLGTVPVFTASNALVIGNLTGSRILPTNCGSKHFSSWTEPAANRQLLFSST